MKIGGEAVHTVYHYDLYRRIKRAPRRGIHKGGIHFHYYLRRELEREFLRYFRIIRIGYIDITIPGEVRLNISSKIGGIISALAGKIFFLNKFAHLILIKVRKIFLKDRC